MENVKLKILEPKFFEVTIGDKSLYFSYETLVAVRDRSAWFRTDKKYSATTSKHLNRHIPSPVVLVSPETLQELSK